MNALYLQVRLASVADASCKDRATPSAEHHLLPLAVPWSPGGLPAGGPTSSKGQRDEAASPRTRPAWLQRGSGFSLSLTLLAKAQQPEPEPQVPHFSPLAPPGWLRSHLLSVWVAFHLW